MIACSPGKQPLWRYLEATNSRSMGENNPKQGAGFIIFNENDRLGGLDSYISSKVCVEFLFLSYLLILNNVNMMSPVN